MTAHPATNGRVSAPTLLSLVEPHLHRDLSRWPDRHGEYHADCPYCQKPAKPSQTHFSIASDGRCYCHVCKQGTGMRALAEHLGVDFGTTRQSNSHSVEYDYHDAAGQMIYQVVRYYRDGQKQFYQRRPDGQGGWIKNLKGVQRTLYRLPAVLRAVAEGEPIYVVEGEKDTDTLRLHGLTATTNTGGAGKWHQSDALLLKGADVVVLPDNDEPGERHAADVLRSLHGVARSMRVVRLPGLPPKGDVSDWLDAGHTIEQLLDVVSTAAEIEPGLKPDESRHTASTQRQRVQEDSAPDEPDESAVLLELGPASSFPELPESAKLDEALGADACPWLDEYIAFSQYWSPRSYDGFHEACGLWVLSTVAARRVVLPFGGERFTNLYIALCARTSLWAKSTAAKIAMETIHAAGASSLLAADNATPQAFIKDLAEQLPENWNDLPQAVQDAHRQKLAFAGQRGWSYEEFGQHLSAMMRDNSTMADYRGHLRRFDDCPPEYTYLTIGRGANTIRRPYLALLANLTPADLAPFARKGSALWNDGFFARYAFITPPANIERRRDRFPLGDRSIPATLTDPLRDWHMRLGFPTVNTTEQIDEKGRPKGNYQLEVVPAYGMRCTLGPGVYDAFYCYLEALSDLIANNQTPADLDGTYTRFPEKALRIAMLLASLTNDGVIELRHWARAQAITERWRRSIHHLIDHLCTPEESAERQLEDKTLQLFARYGDLTARDAGRLLHISSAEAERILEQMVKAGTLQVQQGKRTKRYRPAPDASVASVTASHMSHPAANSDTSAGASKGNTEVSQNKEECDGMTYVTVATLPTEVRGDGVDWPQVFNWLADGDDAALGLYCFQKLHRPIDEVKAEALRRWPELAPLGVVANCTRTEVAT